MPRRNIPVPVGPDEKYCFQCATALPKQRFDVDRSTLDGRSYACRPCIEAKQRSAASNKRHLNAVYQRLTAPL